ncbi:MAG: efflux RND transporter periplasmic adaptor subunit [Lachnospiraceae bacterium]|nr:efflux RND transporter periplasmic adaptor subunit [Lachnospiraceae bacterium]
MRRQYRKPYTRIISLIAATACLIAPVSGCGQAEEEETMSEVIPVLVQQPEAGSLTLKNEFVGTVSPEEAVYVISMVSAEVVSTNVSVGDVVNAGDVLCELDSEAAQLQLASAKVQYESAAAGANAAQIGYEAANSQYEMAQSQYESTVAQLDAQMWGQKNLQIYQLQMQIENIEASIDGIYEQKADLAEQREYYQKLKEQLKGLTGSVNGLENEMNLAQERLDSALAEITALDQLGEDGYNAQAAIDGESVTYEEAKAIAQAAAESAQTDKVTIENNATSLAEQLDQVEAAIKQLDSGEKQLDSALKDAYRGLEQTQTIMNITQDQVYADTQKIVDANKQTAALSLDSASLGIDSAAASVSSAQIGVEGAQIAIDSAEYQLDMYTLKAPISGVIEAVNVQEHGFASPSNPAYIISNKDTMTVTFYVSEGIRNTLKVGQQVSVDRNGKLYDAAITEIGSMIDQTTGLFAVKTCVSSPDESLLTGCSVKVTADTYSQGGVILIPYDAVYYDDSQPYVYVAVDGVVERRDIETGIFDAETITVLSGLTIQDQLITSWSANLREGALVSIQSQQDSNAAGSGE